MYREKERIGFYSSVNKFVRLLERRRWAVFVNRWELCQKP